MIIVMLLTAISMPLPYGQSAFWVTNEKTPSFYSEGEKVGQIAGYWDKGIVYNPPRHPFGQIPFTSNGQSQYFRLEDLCTDPRESAHWKKALAGKMGANLREAISQAACLEETPQLILIDIIVEKLIEAGLIDRFKDQPEDLGSAKVKKVLTAWTQQYCPPPR